MRGFRKYFKEDEDVKKTLDKLPKKHRELAKGFDIRFEPRNTLHGDKDHVGLITNEPKKRIHVASPWNYGREFTLIHEIGHLVYEKWIRGTPLEKEWAKLAMSNKDRKKDESAEELFCHAYANHYVKHRVVIHDYEPWHKFMDKLGKKT